MSLKNGKKLDIRYPILAINPEDAFTKILLQAASGNTQWLDSGRPIKDLDLRPRELLGLILLAHVEKKRTGLVWHIATDHSYGDGTVVVADKNIKNAGIPVEQVYITTRNRGTATLAAAVLSAVKEKEDVSDDYPKDRALVVLVNETGQIDIEAVFGATTSSPFENVVVIGLLHPRQFHFYVGFKNDQGATEGYEVRISKLSGAAQVTKAR